MKKVIFFDPHPGLSGCLEFLPPEVGAVADELEETVGTIEGAVEMIRKVVEEITQEEFEVSVHPTDKLIISKPDPPGHGMICLQIGEFGKEGQLKNMLIKGHSWRVLRYRPLEE